MSKRADAPYQPGRRSPAWRKPALIRTTEVIIVGYKPGGGRREDTVGSLVLGAYDDADRLVYVGGVGTGFTTAMLDELQRLLRPLERATSPLASAIPAAEARGVRWVKPRLVGEVVYRTVRPDQPFGHTMSTSSVLPSSGQNCVCLSTPAGLSDLGHINRDGLPAR